MKKIIREASLEWWDSLSEYNARELCYKYFPSRNFLSLNWGEIKEIYDEEMEDKYLSNEAKQEYKHELDGSKVDFKMLLKYLSDKEDHNEEFRNLAKFIELLSKSSSFAHKAHKELKKLNHESN